MSTPFFGDRFLLFAHVPCQAIDIFFFFSPDVLDLLRPKYRKKYNEAYLTKQQKTKTKKHSVARCQISGYIAKKRRGHWMLKKIRVVRLNQQPASEFTTKKITPEQTVSKSCNQPEGAQVLVDPKVVQNTHYPGGT